MIGNRLRNGLTGLGLALALAWPASASAQRLHGSGEASNLALDAVVVTAGGKEEHKREVTTNITIIGEKEIGRSTARDLAGLLAQNGLQTY